jgi:hypothetical protein
MLDAPHGTLTASAARAAAAAVVDGDGRAHARICCIRRDTAPRTRDGPLVARTSCGTDVDACGAC